MSDKIREAFEKFAAAHHELKWYDAEDWDTDAGYGSVLMQLAYETWTAALAQQSAPAAPVAQEPVAWPAAAHDLVRDWQTGIASSNEVCIALASAICGTPPVAEQPDTVAVPRELLEELADIADAMQCYDARDDAIALLAGGEA